MMKSLISILLLSLFFFSFSFGEVTLNTGKENTQYELEKVVQEGPKPGQYTVVVRYRVKPTESGSSSSAGAGGESSSKDKKRQHSSKPGIGVVIEDSLPPSMRLVSGELVVQTNQDPSKLWQEGNRYVIEARQSEDPEAEAVDLNSPSSSSDEEGTASSDEETASSDETRDEELQGTASDVEDSSSSVEQHYQPSAFSFSLRQQEQTVWLPSAQATFIPSASASSSQKDSSSKKTSSSSSSQQKKGLVQVVRSSPVSLTVRFVAPSAPLPLFSMFFPS